MEEILGKLLIETHRNLERHIMHFLDEYSLGNGQFAILIDISEEEGISQDSIAKKRHVDKSAIAKSIKRLIENGYVYKERDKLDKRAYCLYYTEKGKALIPRIKEIFELQESIIRMGSNSEEIRIFTDYLKRINENIDLFFHEL